MLIVKLFVVVASTKNFSTKVFSAYTEHRFANTFTDKAPSQPPVRTFRCRDRVRLVETRCEWNRRKRGWSEGRCLSHALWTRFFEVLGPCREVASCRYSLQTYGENHWVPQISIKVTN